MPIGDVDALSIHAATPLLRSVHLDGEMTWWTFQDFDTSGTNIHASYESGDFVLSGRDTVENYETVLKRVRVDVIQRNGYTNDFSFYAIDNNNVAGPRSHDLMTCLDVAAPTIDLGNNGPDGQFSTTFTVGGAPVPIVDPAGLSILRRRESSSLAPGR